MNRIFIWISLILTLSVLMPRKTVKAYALDNREKPCVTTNKEDKPCSKKCHRQHSDLPDKKTPLPPTPCQQQTLICCEIQEDFMPSLTFYFQKANFPEQPEHLDPDLKDINKPPENTFYHTA